ncbi:MAG: hypothetical protein WKF71_11985, partial [Pyrinomonadaceae bacterium]
TYCLMFQTEHGPSLIDGVSLFKRSGGDEVNVVEKGKITAGRKSSQDETRGDGNGNCRILAGNRPGKRNVLSRQLVSRIQKQFLFSAR